MKVLVTGVYGFLGLHLANALVENYEVDGLFNLNIKA
jgi:nucleoside-diphosphate-sugar epimerase